MGLTREQIAERAAMDLQDGDYVNLGIGIPTLVGNYIPPDKKVILHSENGVLAMGPFPYRGEENPDLINAGKQTITILPGASFFDSSAAFGMIRGSHVDVTILGGLQVAENGDLANWMIPGQMAAGMGGAMDLVAGAKRVLVLMEHVTKKGKPKIYPQCTLPLTGAGVVDRVITDLCVMDVTPNGLLLVELAPGVTQEQVREQTAATFHASPALKEMTFA
ncbi:MAG: CoA transferase subunit B [Nitrospinota bacterium]